jgi:hypothetical protein
VDNININIGKLDFPTSFQVLESKDEVLILRNDWLRNAQTLLDWNNSCLTVQKGLIANRIPVAFTKTSPVEFQPFSEHQEPFDFDLDQEFYENEELRRILHLLFRN